MLPLTTGLSYDCLESKPAVSAQVLLQQTRAELPQLGQRQLLNRQLVGFYRLHPSLDWN